MANPTSGTRTEPMDSYKFVRGTTAIFKFIPEHSLQATTLDVGFPPIATIIQPAFISGNGVPQVLATIEGVQVPGQEFEWSFTWQVPADLQPLDDYIIQYEGVLGGLTLNFGNEYFSVMMFPEQITMRVPSYATPDDIRARKFNIDSYLPKEIASDLNARNRMLSIHLKDASNKLREELALFQIRSNKENYKLFCIKYAIYTILLAARGEDGSSVSDENLRTWKAEWQAILEQEKRQGANTQSVSFGRG